MYGTTAMLMSMLCSKEWHLSLKCNSWIYLMLLKCKKIKNKIYKEDMNKGTLCIFLCLKIFLLHKCPNTDHNFLYRVKIFCIHVNILYDITLQFLIKSISCATAVFNPVSLCQNCQNVMCSYRWYGWQEAWKSVCSWQWGINILYILKHNL